jgi:triosephosphate isomerase
VRPLLFAANWKMHLGPAAARDFMQRFLQVTSPAPERSLWFFPPAVSIAAVVEASAGRRDVVVGAQNVHWEPKGAFTGELSVPLVKEAGARAVLIGHSERRHLFGETDDQIGRKVTSALKGGDALFENRVGRIHDARIDVAEDLKIEQGRSVVGVFEHERGRLVDRRGARAGCRIWLRAGMDA